MVRRIQAHFVLSAGQTLNPNYASFGKHFVEDRGANRATVPPFVKSFLLRKYIYLKIEKKLVTRLGVLFLSGIDTQKNYRESPK